MTGAGAATDKFASRRANRSIDSTPTGLPLVRFGRDSGLTQETGPKITPAHGPVGRRIVPVGPRVIRRIVFDIAADVRVGENVRRTPHRGDRGWKMATAEH